MYELNVHIPIYFVTLHNVFCTPLSDEQLIIVEIMIFMEVLIANKAHVKEHNDSNDLYKMMIIVVILQ